MSYQPPPGPPPPGPPPSGYPTGDFTGQYPPPGGGMPGWAKGVIIAAAALAVGGLAVVGALLVFGSDADVNPPPSSAATTVPVATIAPLSTTPFDVEGRPVDAFSLVVGDCFDLPTPGESISEIEVIDCAKTHDAEIYLLYDLPGAEFPGTDEVSTQAFDGCLEQFTAFVDSPYDTSVLDIWTLVPTSESWDEGDREVVCSVIDFGGGKLVGSMEGTGR